MLTEIEVGHEDYDVICPSEYIIERMLRKGLLQPIRKEDIPEHLRYFHNVAPFAEDKFQQMAPHDSVLVSDYTVGYMWGTTGWLYNKQHVNAAEPARDCTSYACEGAGDRRPCVADPV